MIRFLVFLFDFLDAAIHYIFIRKLSNVYDYYGRANNCKLFQSHKIPAWLSAIFFAGFAETMFLLTGYLGIFVRAIGEDPASQAIAQPKFNISHLNLSATMNGAIFWN